jgi:hypothetical protein
MKKGPSDLNILHDAILKLHNAESEYIEAVPIIEKFGKLTAWEGLVYAFRLINHPQYDKCYAWYSDNPLTGKRKFYAVLHIPPIDSPEKAVRASIVRDHQKGE